MTLEILESFPGFRMGNGRDADEGRIDLNRETGSNVESRWYSEEISNRLFVLLVLLITC